MRVVLLGTWVLAFAVPRVTSACCGRYPTLEEAYETSETVVVAIPRDRGEAVYETGRGTRKSVTTISLEVLAAWGHDPGPEVIVHSDAVPPSQRNNVSFSAEMRVTLGEPYVLFLRPHRFGVGFGSCGRSRPLPMQCGDPPSLGVPTAVYDDDFDGVFERACRRPFRPAPMKRELPRARRSAEGSGPHQPEEPPALAATRCGVGGATPPPELVFAGLLALIRRGRRVRSVRRARVPREASRRTSANPRQTTR